MCKSDILINLLLHDTTENKIEWSCVGSFGSEYYSIHYGPINQPLEKWVEQFEDWDNLFIAEVMDGFVYLFKTDKKPFVYYLYVQPDAKSDIIRFNVSTSKDIEKLYKLVSKNVSTNESKLYDFVESYIQSHWILDDE